MSKDIFVIVEQRNGVVQKVTKELIGESVKLAGDLGEEVVAVLMGYNIKGDPASAVDLESLCHSVGIDNVAVCDPYNLDETIAVIKEQLEKDGPSVVISRRPCALLKYVKHNPPFSVEADKCIGCKMCLSIGCPAISIKDGKAQIDNTQCVGCGVCKGLCKKSAIVE